MRKHFEGLAALSTRTAGLRVTVKTRERSQEICRLADHSMSLLALPGVMPKRSVQTTGLWPVGMIHMRLAISSAILK